MVCHTSEVLVAYSRYSKAGNTLEHAKVRTASHQTELTQRASVDSILMCFADPIWSLSVHQSEHYFARAQCGQPFCHFRGLGGEQAYFIVASTLEQKCAQGRPRRGMRSNVDMWPRRGKLPLFGLRPNKRYPPGVGTSKRISFSNVLI